MSTSRSRAGFPTRSNVRSSTQFSTALHTSNARPSLPVRRTMAAEHSDPSPLWGEFELIDKLFAPLARGLAGAFALEDDVAVLPAKPGHDLVLKTDSLIESVHFLRDDPADTVAQKALRRALSDLAAKGAEPQAYLLAIALPGAVQRNWLERFVQGLSSDQKTFGI